MTVPHQTGRAPSGELSIHYRRLGKAGKTPIRYKDVQVGMVEEIRLRDDLSGVVCTARMVKGFEPYLVKGTIGSIVAKIKMEKTSFSLESVRCPPRPRRGAPGGNCRTPCRPARAG